MKTLLRWLFAAVVVATLSFFWGTHVGEKNRFAIREVLHGWFGLGHPPSAPDTPDSDSHAGAAMHQDAKNAKETKNGSASLKGNAPSHAQQEVPEARAPATPIGTRAVDSAGQAEPNRGSLNSMDNGAEQAGRVAAGARTSSLLERTARGDIPLHIPVTVRVKIVVDDRYARTHSDWLSRVQRTVALAAAAYRKAVQVDLQLAGVVRFMEPLDGLDNAALRRMLRRHPREGADLVLGLVDRALDPQACKELRPSADTHRVYGLVGLSPLSGADHLQDSLRCVGQLLGAAVITEPTQGAFQSGSWMRSLPLAGKTSKPWLDGQSRARIMSRKSLTFSEAGQ